MPPTENVVDSHQLWISPMILFLCNSGEKAEGLGARVNEREDVETTLWGGVTIKESLEMV